MKRENKPGSEAIQIFVPTLPDTPGWVALPYDKQQQIVEHTSHIQQYRQMQRLGEFGELLELTQVQQLLDGEEMRMDDYLRMLYPAHHQRTILRKQHAFAELSAHIPNSLLKKITGLGQDVLSRFERITTAALGDIQNAIRDMPLLPVTTNQAAEKYLEELDAKLMEERQTRRKKGLKIKGDEGYAAKMATNAVLHYIRNTKLKTSAEKRQWLKRMLGWVMEAQAISGSLTASRVSIPDGILIRRGRPPLPKNKAKE